MCKRSQIGKPWVHDSMAGGLFWVLFFCFLGWELPLGRAAPAGLEPADAAGVVSGTNRETEPVFVPRAELDLLGLMQVVWERSAALQQEHLSVEVARADARQSRLWDNPVLDGAVGTLPVGPTNPPDLERPLANIPNYSVGISLHPDFARRGPRTERADGLSRSADLHRKAAVRMQALLLLRKLGNLATATLRLVADQHLAVQARGTLALAKERVRTGFGTPLDADRAEMELLRLEQQVIADQGERLSLQADCAEFVGVRCASFVDDSDARRFLSAWLARADEVSSSFGLRPDVLALSEQVAASVFERRLAVAQRVPDPTVRMGYMYDSFLVSGNQQHSLNVSLSFPLPFLDHGQAGVQAAEARARRFAEQKRLLMEVAQAKTTSLRQALALQKKRLSTLQEQVVPRAQGILRDVRRAFEARAVPLTDLNQAQRSLDELNLQEAGALGDAFGLSADLIEEGVTHE